MRAYWSFDRTQVAYIIPASLYTLWQACSGWLNHYWTFVYLGREPAALLYITFFLSHALGIAAFAWWLDRLPDMKKIKQVVFLSSVLSGLLTSSMAFISGKSMGAIVLICGLISGFGIAYLTSFLFAEIPVNKRGLTIGSAAALGLALHFIVYVVLFPEQDGPILYGKTLFAAVTMLLLAVSVLYVPACHDYLWETSSETNRINFSPGSIRPGLLMPLFLIMTGFFLSHGLQDYSATAFWLGGADYLAYTRIFLIAGFLGGGMLCDLRGTHMVLNSSFSLLAMGFVAMAFQYQGVYSFMAFSCVQAASAIFSIGSRLALLDIARFYKKPLLVCSLGLVFPLVLKQFGIISAEILYKTMGNMSIFIASLVAIVAALPLVSLLFSKVTSAFIESFRSQTLEFNLASASDCSDDLASQADGLIDIDDNPADEASTPDNPAPDSGPISWADMAREFSQKYGFNPRESQVLNLTLQGLSVAEMADSLHIAESTVKQYIRQMLRKTETKNRRELLSMLIKEQNSGI